MPDYENDLPDDDDVDYGPSKSELKREKQALQNLAKKIIELPKGHYVRIPLSQDMRDAMALYKRLKHNEAKRRQLQYIGKHMHTEDLAAVNNAFTQLENESRLFRQHFHKLEQMRDALIENGDDALGDVLEEFPHLNRQEIRTLIRQALKEKAQKKPPAASRKLFKYLRDHTEIEG